MADYNPDCLRVIVPVGGIAKRLLSHKGVGISHKRILKETRIENDTIK